MFNQFCVRFFLTLGSKLGLFRNHHHQIYNMHRNCTWRLYELWLPQRSQSLFQIPKLHAQQIVQVQLNAPLFQLWKYRKWRTDQGLLWASFYSTRHILKQKYLFILIFPALNWCVHGKRFSWGLRAGSCLKHFSTIPRYLWSFRCLQFARFSAAVFSASSTLNLCMLTSNFNNKLSSYSPFHGYVSLKGLE